MLRTLPSRLVLSHALPVLILVPLLGLVLLYQIEQSYFWDDLATELTVQGELIAELIGPNWAFWQDPNAAHRIWARVQVSTPSSIMLLDRHGTLLSSTDPVEQAIVDLTPDLALVQQTVQEGRISHLESNTPMGPQVLTVIVPIQDERGQVVGVVRIAHRVAALQEQLWLLRWTILTTLLVGGTLSLALGLLLARSLSLPLVHLTRAVACFRLGEKPFPIPDQGPEEIRALAQTYDRMRQQLYDLESSRRKLLAGVVHELARPLGGIKAAAQTICKNEQRDLNIEMASGIDHAVDQLQFQLEDLTLLGQIELQALKLAQESVDLAAVVEAQCRQFRLQAEQKRIKLHCQTGDEPLIVQGDPRRLGQIVGNLVHNGIKYTPADGRIDLTVCVKRRDRKLVAVVRVMDTGPGIDLAEQESIFDFFYRSPQQQRIHQGLGIGLALSRWLAEAHGGTLIVQSQPGQGATFELALPLLNQRSR